MSEKKDKSKLDNEAHYEDEKTIQTDKISDEKFSDVNDSGIVESDIENNDENLENQVKDLKDRLMRTLADSENLRKRTIKEIEHAKKYSHITFVRDLISSVDNLQRALESVPDDKSKLSEPVKNLIIGLDIVEKEIITTFEKHNLKQIQPLGEKFDYNLHQAMFEVPTNDSEPGIVVEVSQKGYLLHDRLVRPAMVGISKKIEDVEVSEKKTDEI
ncbi:nucleotide exchange factor GrpE [Alphaproteobacteria bacterium]|nr:nucleotide exchange factor GrpE [Alphaproteobacteria bacterium]